MLRHSPVDGDHNLILLSGYPPPLTSFEPSGAHTKHKTEPLLIIDFFSNGALRLSPGEGGKDATLGKMQSPVALELLELLARSHIPQPDAVVVWTKTPAARCEHGAVERESDVVDRGTVLVL